MGFKSIRQFLDWQRFFFFLLTLSFAAFPTTLFANLLWRAGIDQGLVSLTILFAILNWNIAWGATHSLIGFFKRRMKRRKREQRFVDLEHPGSVAIVLPVYNEDPVRVFAGLQAMYESLQKTDFADRFDFFILSDSTRPERWVEEEHRWASLCRELGAFGRINYRRRSVNTDKKAGNLLEFCESWGARYRYMLTLDADSVLSGETIVELYKRMEENPRMGILQTAPKIVYSESFWGRLQQFSNHFYGPIFTSGLNFWQGNEGNYWGHNAIIRMSPFMEHCALPDLPGREPFGGKILSHDFVEAALMQRAGFDVCLAEDLEGTYEECPQDVIEHAKRDRRWCQGNMQHFWLLFSRGLTMASRMHLGNGIMGYASSLLWGLFMLFGGILVFNRFRSQLSILPTRGIGQFFDIPLHEHSILVASITFSFLFLPKVLALLDAFLSKGRCRAFGGRLACVGGVLLELLASAVIAPVMMLYHAQFVLSTAFGKGVGWSTQNRNAGEGLTFRDAFAAHKMHALIGVVATVLASRVNMSFLLWTLPVTGAMIISPIVSRILSSPKWGRNLRGINILATPEELNPSEELISLREIEQRLRRSNRLFSEDPDADGLMNAVVDPYINAIRVTLAREEESRSQMVADTNKLGMELLHRGPEALGHLERKLFMSDSKALLRAHKLVWTLDLDSLHPSWAPLFRRYHWSRAE
ncbi:glucans biosynthesis glucosyltransferase MdoH [Pelagicoccus sp. SDUM812003]|uniref:glucans biosynthesis glucosyltransferase MdoH n=1 Tax=Pelagicoccus sp. SDUM812003 TaxID=3041267 RepID=UPI00280D0A94|nr:glucans biosynthesis glucosyltransferase MdoH [Pelagicoccus sp. SDUM812003]MDQ8201714.1 glucans biosynthesis glucosyltransferase MdoH [Pelagicoccus sp. SDUM812003]